MATSTLSANGTGTIPHVTVTELPPGALVVNIPRIEIRRVQLRLIGDSPLICHAWSEKAKKQMRDKQMKKATQAKEAKDPEAEFRASLYPLPGGGYGFPCVGFKAAAVAACRQAEMKMVEARGLFHVNGEFARIESDEPVLREDMVRVGMGTADLRYRGEFSRWAVTLDVSYNARAISPEQIINLFNLAGFGVGVGEWRPEKDGPYGRFHVAAEGEAP